MGARRSTGEALEPVPGRRPCMFPQGSAGRMFLMRPDAGRPRRPNGTNTLPDPPGTRTFPGRQSKRFPGPRLPHSVPALCVAESIFTLEAYSLGVMPVTFLKWREK